MHVLVCIIQSHSLNVIRTDLLCGKYTLNTRICYHFFGITETYSDEYNNAIVCSINGAFTGENTFSTHYITANVTRQLILCHNRFDHVTCYFPASIFVCDNRVLLRQNKNTLNCNEFCSDKKKIHWIATSHNTLPKTLMSNQHRLRVAMLINIFN